KPRYLLASVSLCMTVALFLGNGDQRSAAQGSKAGAVKHSSGRVLPPMPEIKEPVMFNTREADTILAAMQVFPVDNPWNEDISQRPLLKNSREMVATVGNEGKLAVNLDMGFILVPPNQKKVDVKIARNQGEAYGG